MSVSTEINTVEACTDCYMYAAGYDSHEIGYEPEYAPLSKFKGIEVYAETMEGDAHFVNAGCNACDSPLAGNRYPIAIVGG